MISWPNFEEKSKLSEKKKLSELNSEVNSCLNFIYLIILKQQVS